LDEKTFWHLVGEGDRLAVSDQLLFGKTVGLNSGMVDSDYANKELGELYRYANESKPDRFIRPSDQKIDLIKAGMERMMERMTSGKLWGG
jgi:hypothetical protein